MATVEKMKPLEIELKRLEDLAEDIVNDFAYMRQREQEMRDTNGSYALYAKLHQTNFMLDNSIHSGLFLSGSRVWYQL